MAEPLLQVQNLKIGFATAQGIKPLVQGITFDLYSGKTLALLGESGSGKSLTALALMQLLPPAARTFHDSQAIYQGQDLLALSELSMRSYRGRDLAMIFQEPMTALNPVLTIGRQVAKKAQKNRALELLRAVGIPEPKTCYAAYPHQLSGGMKQRVMIAMALMGNPKILIADEPTTALDVTTQAQILQLLQDLQRQTGLAILLITHDWGVAAQVADTVAVMQAGKIVEMAPTRELLSAPQHVYTQQLLAAIPNLFSVRAGSTMPDQKNPLLKIRDLRVYFPIKKGFIKRTVGFVKAVDGVNLDLVAGKTLALVGESGSGKTTLGKAIVQLLKESSGSVKFEGQEINGLKKSQLRPLRSSLQFIFQDPFSSLDPRMLVQAIIAEGLLAQRKIKSADLIERVASLLDQVGLSADSSERYPHEFSGGQRQRIAIARALVLKPKILICDEPTSALDVSIQAQILNLLKRLQQELGLSYLLITHNLGVVSELADTVAVMYLGRIVEQGSVQDIMLQPKHPYTQALIAAVPSIEPRSAREVLILPGEPPSPANPPSGCPFHPRCPHAMPVCREQYPRVTELSPTQKVNCHLHKAQNSATLKA